MSGFPFVGQPPPQEQTCYCSSRLLCEVIRLHSSTQHYTVCSRKWMVIALWQLTSFLETDCVPQLHWHYHLFPFRKVCYLFCCVCFNNDNKKRKCLTVWKIHSRACSVWEDMFKLKPLMQSLWRRVRKPLEQGDDKRVLKEPSICFCSLTCLCQKLPTLSSLPLNQERRTVKINEPYMAREPPAGQLCSTNWNVWNDLHSCF